ncbi:MAG: nicotinamide-nucleotide amidohydrolase family protein [Simkaniaceae bacterium]|nr:nicotinamide-nucleotide amidohydrolase family protein [Simkaniaceae bacterium]
MKIALLTIGDEILAGSTLNTNVHFLSKHLTDAGYLVCEHRIVSDGAEPLKRALDELFATCDYIISTGGLGPTVDDITRHVVADYFGMGFKKSELVYQDLLARYGSSLDSLEDQATLPERAKILPNTMGTAPGLWFDEGGKVLVLLPGVPSQMEAIFTSFCLPTLINHCPLEEKLFSLSLYFFHINENQVDPFIRELKSRYPAIDFGIYPSYGFLGIKLSAIARDDSSLAAPANEILKKFQAYFYSDTSPNLARALQEKMVKKGLKLGLAESCTGGAFAARLTAIADASQYFMGSVVSYSNHVKESVLGVESLAKHGAVSEETVIEMADGARKLMECDYAISISGIAGPTGGTKDKPVGTIWAAIASKEGTRAMLVPARPHFSRAQMVSYTIDWLMGELLSTIN